MLQGSKKIKEEIKINEINDNTSAMVPYNASNEVAVKGNKDKETQDKEAQVDIPLVFEHETVAKVASAATTVGATVGGFMGTALSPDLAQAGSDAVRNVIKEQGDQLGAQILKETGLDKIPGGTLLVKQQVTDIAHSAGEATYNNIKNEMGIRGAALGGATSGIATVAIMEGVNLLSYGYNAYVLPYFEARKEYNDNLESQRQAQLELNNDMRDSTVESIDGEEFVLIGDKKISM